MMRSIRYVLIQKKTETDEAMLVAEGEIGRTKMIVAAQDFSFMGGSMGMYVGNAIIVACKLAVEKKCPLVLFSLTVASNEIIKTQVFSPC